MTNAQPEKLQKAFLCFNARDLAGTERLCKEILNEAPRDRGALHLLGVARLAAGNAVEAVQLIGGALQGGAPDVTMLEHFGTAHLALGNHDRAESAFRHALELGATHGQLYMRLGLALAQQGKLSDAVAALREAAVKSPGDPDVLLNLGNTLAEIGRAEEALACYDRVLASQPNHAPARYNLGNLFHRMGRLDEAQEAFKQVLAIAPNDADTHNNLGTVQEQMGRTAEAIESYLKSLALDPAHVHAHSNLGHAWWTQTRLEEAAASCERALAIRGDFIDALINLGNVRADQRRFLDAQALYERVLRIDPRNADAHRNLGMLFRTQGRMKEATACYRAAIELAPERAAGYADLGGTLRDSGDFESAIAAYQRAIAIDPRFALAHYDLAETFKVSGRLDDAIAAYGGALELKPDDAQALSGLVHVRQHVCSWDGIEELWERLRRAMSADAGTGVSPFRVLSLPTSAAEQLACARGWAQRELAPAIAERSGLAFDFSAPRARDRPRIGYLSWGFHRHATAYLTAELFELHDRDRFEVFAYACGPDDGSAIRARIRNACEHFTDVSADSHVAAARRIHDDGVDILVDLTGYTLGARTQILALQPAPVQVNWLGYPGTMGADCVDYIIADPFIIPPGQEAGYTEKVVRLPDCYQINDRRREVSDRVPSREACGLPAQGVVFCCFNHAYKILPETFGLWLRIVQAAPASVLWLGEANPWMAGNLRRAAVARGVAAERLVFAPRKPLPDYLVQYRLADLALDTFPYTSHTLASDALWMGCPLVTRVGETFASRVAGSILINAGMRELVTENPGDYERRVVDLATSPGKLESLRRRLQETRDSCPLFDTPRFVRNLEDAYEKIFSAFVAASRR